MEVLRFGRKQHLIGILDRAPLAKVAVILWNTGVSNRTGPFRANVEASAALVAKGYTVFRFDLSKLGDSSDPLENHSWQIRSSLDLKDALDTVSAHCGITDFVLVGLCSGAIDAYYFALEDQRIRGIFMVDGVVYPTPRHQLTLLATRMASPYRWKRLIKKIIAKFKYVPSETMPEDYFESNYPEPGEASKGFQNLIDRSVALQLIYTGGFTPYYSYRRQFFDMLPGLAPKAAIDVLYWPDVDHLFMLQEDRTRFIHKLSSWLEAKVPAQTLSLPPPQTRSERKAPDATQTLNRVLEIFNRILTPSKLEAEDSFFDFGGTSVLALRASAELSETLGLDIPVVALYTHMRASALAQAIVSAEFTASPSSRPLALGPESQGSDDAFAIIGMACKVPGADNVQDFWSMILAGKEGITHWQPEQLDASLPPSLIRNPAYVPSRGVIEGDRFDAAFFKISKREAQLLDPQQRVLLESCWQALEDSGYAGERSQHRIAVYAGVGSNTYLTRHLAQGHFAAHSEEEYLALLMNDKDYVATRIAHAMNLKGPAISVHTACSTSLVAVIEAIKALKAGQADMAIAGAAAVNAPIASGHLYQDGGIFSRDGHCRPFDAAASGTLFSDGAAVVVLKSLNRALADKDQIYAVIKGWGLNNDGADKSSFAAPSVLGQAEAIRQAISVAGIDPATVGYIECHGTGTAIGDPIELEGLKRAYGPMKTGHCALGSCKANIGHLTAAAGTTSLIKAALAIQHGIKPALTNFREAHPNLRLEQSPFTIPTRNQEWKGLKRAGVSSFGIGGTNAHVILEESPQVARPLAEDGNNPLDPWLTLRWTAATAEDCRRLAQDLKVGPSPRDLSYTLAHRRPRLAWGSATTGIAAIDVTSSSEPKLMTARTKLVFSFPGQGSQYLGMGLELSQGWPRFAKLYQKALQHFKEHFQLDLQKALHDEALLKQTQYTQPLLFAFEWSLAEAMRGAGFEVFAVLGHSLGEVSAAAVAAILSFEDAATLVYHRARLMQKSEPGLMLAIRCSLERLTAFMNPSWDLAAENSERGLVAAGSQRAIEDLEAALSSQEIPHKRLNTEHAFHSRQMDRILPEFEAIVARLSFQAPKTTFYSSVTGRVLTASEAISPRYWVEQIRKPVLFKQALNTISQLDSISFVEIGPKDTLLKFIQQSGKASGLSALPRGGLSETEELGLLFSALSCQDHAPFIAAAASVVSAAPYPFRGERYWLEPRSAQSFALKKTPPSLEVSPMSDRRIVKLLAALLDQAPESLSIAASWSELGMDSLLLTQWALKLQREFAYDVNLRRLQTDIPNLKTLMALFGTPAKLAPPQGMPSDAEADIELAVGVDMGGYDVQAGIDTRAVQKLMNDQIQLMNRQLDIMQRLLGGGVRAAAEEFAVRDLEPQVKERTKVYQFINDRGSQSLEAPEGAFLGLDEYGQPALYLEDSQNPGSFLKLEKN